MPDKAATRPRHERHFITVVVQQCKLSDRKIDNDQESKTGLSRSYLIEHILERRAASILIVQQKFLRRVRDALISMWKPFTELRLAQRFRSLTVHREV